MARGKYVNCPACTRQFLIGEEFFALPEAKCHCPFCHAEFSVSGTPPAADPRAATKPI